MKIITNLKRLNPKPAQSCGECRYYQSLHDITKTLTEGWCRVDEQVAMVLSEDTCDKWHAK